MDNKMKNEVRNDMMELFDIELPPEATYQLADIGLVNFYKDYKNRVLWIDKDVSDNLFEEIRMVILWNREDDAKNIPVEERKDITLMVHSYGGQLDAAFAMIDVMNLSKTPIKTVNVNAAMSAGALIFLNGHKGKRYCMPMSTALIHEGSGGSRGTYEQVQAQNENYKKLMDMMKENIKKHTTISSQTLGKWKNKEIYLYANDQIKYNLADHIISDISDIL